jgi:hypothetical protein
MTWSQSLSPDILSQELSQVVEETPCTAKALCDELHLFDQLDQDSHTKKLLFQKIKQGIRQENHKPEY